MRLHIMRFQFCKIRNMQIFTPKKVKIYQNVLLAKRLWDLKREKIFFIFQSELIFSLQSGIKTVPKGKSMFFSVLLKKKKRLKKHYFTIPFSYFWWKVLTFLYSL